MFIYSLNSTNKDRKENFYFLFFLFLFFEMDAIYFDFNLSLDFILLSTQSFPSSSSVVVHCALSSASSTLFPCKSVERDRKRGRESEKNQMCQE